MFANLTKKNLPRGKFRHLSPKGGDVLEGSEVIHKNNI